MAQYKTHKPTKIIDSQFIDQVDEIAEEENAVILLEPIWQQQKHLGENDEYYSHFLIYADLDPADRSVTSAWKKHTGRDTSSSHWQARCAEFRWVKRAAARDVALQQENSGHWALREANQSDTRFSLGEMLINLGQLRVQQLSYNLDEISVPQAIKLIELGIQLQDNAKPEEMDEGAIKNVLAQLPEGKREVVIKALVARITEE